MKWSRPLGLIGIAAVLIIPVVLQQVDKGSRLAVVTEVAKRRTVRESVSASGSLIYEREAQLSPEVIGRVTDVLVKEGDHVAPGVPVVRIDDEPFRAAAAQQQAAVLVQERVIARQQLVVGDARRKLERGQALIEKGFISRSGLEQMVLDVNVAESDLAQQRLELTRARAVLDQAQLQLKRTIIRAPIAGSVIAVSIKAGETAVPSAIGIPGSSLVAIADRDSIVADLNVDESDVSHLLIGQPAAIYCPPMPATALNGNILAIALALRTQRLGGPDTGGRNYSVKVAFRPDRLTAALRPGMECRATIYTSADQPKVAVPVQAVRTTRTDDVDGYAGSPRQNSRTTDYVFVDEDGVARKRFVTLGVADNLYQQVINGVKENTNVIVGPYRTLVTLADGQRVQPQTSNKN